MLWNLHFQEVVELKACLIAWTRSTQLCVLASHGASGTGAQALGAHHHSTLHLFTSKTFHGRKLLALAQLFRNVFRNNLLLLWYLFCFVKQMFFPLYVFYFTKTLMSLL